MLCGSAANAFDQAESVYPAITYDSLLLNQSPPFKPDSNAWVRIENTYKIHTGRRLIQVPWEEEGLELRHKFMLVGCVGVLNIAVGAVWE